MYIANQFPTPAYAKGLGSIDLSTLSWEDYLIIGGIGAFLISTMWDSRPKWRKRRKRRKSSAAASSGGLGLGIPLGIIAVIGLGTVGYMVWKGSNSEA